MYSFCIYTQYNTIHFNKIQCNHIQTQYNTLQYVVCNNQYQQYTTMHYNNNIIPVLVDNDGPTEVGGFGRRAPQALAASRGGAREGTYPLVFKTTTGNGSFIVDDDLSVDD